ncbi:MAG: hypothetical protein LBH81_03875 [Rickettsiales bacterium]|jgi:hypothetical protein|nr:hypothetical protein [Rickettsiales bacterium]
MTAIAALLLIFGKTIQDFVSKEGTRVLDSRAIALASAAAGSVFYICAARLIPGLWKPDALAIIYGAAGGIAMFFNVRFFADVRRESNSAATFGMLIAVGAAAPINVWLLGEALPLHKTLSCAGLAAIGVLFFIRGAASELSAAGKIKFFAAVLFLMGCVFTDFLALERSNWFTVGAAVAVSYFLASMVSLKGGMDKAFVPSLKYPIFWIIGIVGVAMLVFAKYAQGEILGASLTYAFIRLSVPIVMVLSAYIYKERTPREQLIFGMASYLIAIPLFL